MQSLGLRCHCIVDVEFCAIALLCCPDLIYNIVLYRNVHYCERKLYLKKNFLFFKEGKCNMYDVYPFDMLFTFSFC